VLLRRKQLEIRSTRKRRAHAGIRWNLERWHIVSVDWTVGDEQHAQCFLRRVQRKQRRLDKAIVDRDFLSGAQPVEPGAAAQALQRRRNVEMCLRDFARANVGVASAVAAAVWRLISAALSSATLRLSAAWTRRAQITGAYSGYRMSSRAKTAVCGVTVVPSNSTDLLSVVDCAFPVM
jgi:hypothetical protein